MKTKQCISYWSHLRTLVLGLVLLIGPALSLAPTTAVYAATLTISDQASCQAAGGIWVVLGECRFTNVYTVNAGNTLQLNVLTNFDDLTNNGTVNIGAFAFVGVSENATNNGTINVNSSGRIRFRSTIHNTSTGIIIVNGGQIDLFGGFAEVLNNDGVVTINSGGSLFNDGTVNNNNLIEVKCGGSLSGPGTYTGNPVQNADCTPPAIFAYGAGNLTTSAATVSFDFFVSEYVTGVDASDFALNASGVSGASVAVSGSGGYYQVAVNLGSGDGTLRVELVDNDSIRDLAGNPLGGVGVGNGNASGGTFYIDRTAPNTTITSQPANPSPSSAASFAFTGNDATAGVARFECKLDSAAFATCTSPQNYTALANGNHTFQVYAIDWAGNVDASPASYTWVVQIDSVAPTASPSQSPAANANGWNNSDVTVTWNWADPSTSSGQASGIDPANCTTGSTSNGEGTLTLTATCKDLVGNTGNASTIVKVDTTAPETTITNQPTNPSASGDATFTFNAADSTSGIARFECSLDSAAFANCGSPQSYNSLTNGSHTFALRAIDNAGNVDATPAAYTWVVQIDSTPPAVFAYGASNLTTNAATISFDFFVSEDVTGVDASDFVLNASGVSGASVAVRRLSGAYYFVDVNTGSGDGTLRVELVDNDSIRDLAGNPLGGVGVGNGNASAGTFTIDKTAPETTITSQPANPSTSTTASFAFSGNDATAGVARFECMLDSAAFATCTSPQNYTDLASGSHTFQVRAIDNANNVDASPASYTWVVQIDTVAPTASPSQSPAANANGWNNSDVTVTWNWTDNAGGVGIDPANCTTSSISSGEGALTLTATCKDLAGNEGSASTTVQVDKSAPTISASTTNADGTPYTAPDWTNQDIIVHFTCSDAGSGIADCPADQTISAEGTLPAVQGTATDNAGNSADAFAGPFQIDQTKPVISGSRTPAANAAGWNNSDVTVSFTCADNANGSTIGSDTVAGATVSSEGTNQSVTNTGACVDVAGNVADAATVSNINIDKTAPTLNPVVNPNPVNVGGAATVTSGAADALSGIANQNCGAVDTSTAGVKSVTCTATDNAGNSNSATVNYTVQAVNPGTLVGSCGGYEVRQVGSVYSAAGWSGAIKVGTSGNNTLNGGSGRDLMLGLGGNDLLKGNGGDDILCGGDGVDLVQGFAGNDLLEGGNGNDVLNGGTGDYDQLLAGEGNDVLLDGDGVSNAAGGAGNDVLTIALRNGWRDANGQTRFAGLAAGYGNDAVGLAILNSVPFFVDITGDEPSGHPDNPASPLEGTNDGLALAGVIDPASTIIKFEHVLVVSADAQTQPSEEAGAEYLTEAVGGDERVDEHEEAAQTSRVFLPVVIK